MNINAHAPRGPARRRAPLARLIADGRHGSQEELVSALGRHGIQVTQATLSRDLASLGVGKLPGRDGRAVYSLPSPATEVVDRHRQELDLKSFINEIRLAGQLLIVRTPPGHANGVARAIDLLCSTDVVGSVAGDDTILVVTPSAARARAFRRQLESLADAGSSLAR
ncbi:MAG: arginine repressor [Candidatus Eisenbacteria bacterium]|nr:arginine repressor [Candidatus Eisenbacteria bacterium]